MAATIGENRLTDGFDMPNSTARRNISGSIFGSLLSQVIAAGCPRF